MRFDAPRHLLGDVFSLQSPTVARLAGIHGGELGVRDTLVEMRNFVRASVRSSDQMIRELALQLTLNVPERDYWGEVCALHAFVRDKIRYVMDPEDLELVATPEKTLQYGQGDCDDKSTLLAALLTSINHPSRFVAVGMNGEPFSHVLVESKVGERWVPLETIIQVPPGWFPEGVTSKYILKV